MLPTDLLARFHGNPPASPSVIASCETRLGVLFPEPYREFLAKADGGEGFIGPNAYAILHRVEELAAINEAYAVRKVVPGLLVIGSDGGGEAFCFDARSSHLPVVSVPFVGMARANVQALAPDFGAFLLRLYETPE